MERITDIWISLYFTEPILLNVMLVTFIVSIIKRKKIPSFRWLPHYLGFFLLFFLADYAYTIFLFPANQDRVQRFQREVNFYITLVEMLVFMHFFLAEVRSIPLKRILRLIRVSAVICFLYVYITTHLDYGFITYRKLNMVYIIQLTALLASSGFYFIQLFREAPVSNLKELPGFWIATGLSFYCLCTLPLTIASSYFFNTDRETVYINLYSIIYLFYILLFVLIIRSFLCRPLKTM